MPEDCYGNDGRYPVLITTKHRGVFFGWSDEPAETVGKTIILHGCRNCIYWSADVGGFLGLAEIGPTNGCRIGRQTSRVRLHDVTSAAKVSEEGAKAWTRAT